MINLEQEKPTLTYKEVAKVLGVCVRTVYRMVQDGTLSIIRVRRSVRFKASDISRILSGTT